MCAIPLPVSAGELERLLRAYVDEIPDLVIRAFCARPKLLQPSEESVLEPWVVASGMVFAEGVPGEEESVSLVEENVVLLGQMFKMQFDFCTVAAGATDKLVGNVLRYSRRYELEPGCRGAPPGRAFSAESVVPCV